MTIRYAGLFLAASLGLILNAAACSSGPNTDSQTHWLSACSSDTECGDGLSCLCGVCSQDCSSSNECSTPGPSVCIGSGAGASQGLCEVSPKVNGLCLPECLVDEDCGMSQACRFNSCVPQSEVDRVDERGPDMNMSHMDMDLVDRDMDTRPDQPTPVDMRPDMPPGDMIFVDIGSSPDACMEAPTCPPNGHSVAEAGEPCKTYRCVEEGQLPCGDEMCESGSEYCEVFHAGVPPEGDMDAGPSYSCQTIETSCRGPIECDCLTADDGFPGDCRLREDGLFEVSIFAP